MPPGEMTGDQNSSGCSMPGVQGSGSSGPDPPAPTAASPVYARPYETTGQP